jgi:hypothetical protein
VVSLCGAMAQEEKWEGQPSRSMAAGRVMAAGDEAAGEGDEKLIIVDFAKRNDFVGGVLLFDH